MKEETFDEKWDKGWLISCAVCGAFIAGYLTGRLTAISDLQKGYLNCFIPKTLLKGES